MGDFFMRCTCCNKPLTDFESTRRHKVTNEFLDTCNWCLKSIQREVFLPVSERNDLIDDGGIDSIVDREDENVLPSDFKDYVVNLGDSEDLEDSKDF